ncbi:hypothetical protein DES40_1923 [Litorimonas taeanensis]|uniref:Uncharacterized protein n=1 Tax=Litorimonas taeanensis TaxID=568099 RepID=A0A420WDP1_9PROT|nr:hypothetical protein [Litorimonas taeanensis]RKQ69137.1 hypothetical protein DES40_1923 [Litorimonas taeanensis]
MITATLSFQSYSASAALNGDFDFALDDVSVTLSGAHQLRLRLTLIWQKTSRMFGKSGKALL